MSKQVEFDEVTRGGYRGRLINWEQWCDGKAHQLERGVDYHGPRTDSTRSAGIQWAARHGLKARTAILSQDAFVFQIVEGLSDEQVALAKRLQELARGGASDEALSHELAESRRAVRSDARPEPVEKPVFDPVAARREKLSSENPREVVAESRPMGRKRRV